MNEHLLHIYRAYNQGLTLTVEPMGSNTYRVIAEEIVAVELKGDRICRVGQCRYRDYTHIHNSRVVGILKPH